MSTVMTSRIPPGTRCKSLGHAPAITAIVLASCLMMLAVTGEALAQTKCGTNLQRNSCVQEWQCSSSGEGTNGNWVPKTNEPTGTPCTTTSGLAGKCVAPSRLPGGSIEAATCVANCATSSNGCGGSKSGTGTNKGSSSSTCTATAKSCNLECGHPSSDLTMQEWNACQSSCLSCGKDRGGAGGSTGSAGSTNNNAIVANVIQNPIYVNLYWDTTWDIDNPQ